IGVRDLRKSADHHETVPVGIRAIEGHVRDISHEIGRILDSRIGDALSGEDIDLYRYVLKALAALLSRYHHLFELLVGQSRSREDDGHPNQDRERDRRSHSCSRLPGAHGARTTIENAATEDRQGPLRGMRAIVLGDAGQSESCASRSRASVLLCTPSLEKIRF